ncbi:MAG: sulfite exporter TauE/SafE family protein [Chloroflexi bacterium]|nr:sulfite exporter TauE/SafE family protein [Chloroflexota bacterium]
MDYIIDKIGSAGLVSWLAYALVLLGGVVSALSPCFTPVLAMFGGYVGGYARDSERQPLRVSAAFTAGQAVTLAGLGILAVFVGRSVLGVFTGYELDRYIPAAIGIVMGLHLLRVFRFRLPSFGWLRSQRPGSPGGAFMLGLPFGFVVTPCTIPVFVTIVAYIALNAGLLQGALLMVAYAVGRGVVLGLVAYSAGMVRALRGVKAARYIELASGAVMLAASVYLLFLYPFFRIPVLGA